MAPAQIPVFLTQKPSTENGINRATTLFLAWELMWEGGDCTTVRTRCKNNVQKNNYISTLQYRRQAYRSLAPCAPMPLSPACHPTHPQCLLSARSSCSSGHLMRRPYDAARTRTCKRRLRRWAMHSSKCTRDNIWSCLDPACHCACRAIAH